MASSLFRCPTLLLSRPLMSSLQLRWKHTVRIILLEDLPSGKGHSGEVMHVKAGFARNYLIPNKMALYATPENFVRLGRKDPKSETPEERRERLEREASEELNEELKAATLLSKYLKSKMLQIYRKVDDVGGIHPGNVVAKNLKEKLSIQLKIDLDESERIHIRPEPLLEDYSDEEIQAMVEQIPSDEDCTVQLKKIGYFLAKISLAGGYAVPLRFQVIKKSYTK